MDERNRLNFTFRPNGCYGQDRPRSSTPLERHHAEGEGQIQSAGKMGAGSAVPVTPEYRAKDISTSGKYSGRAQLI